MVSNNNNAANNEKKMNTTTTEPTVRNTPHQHNMKTLFGTNIPKQIVERLAHLYNLPELCAAPLEYLAESAITCAADCRPQGQGGLTWKALEASVKIRDRREDNTDDDILAFHVEAGIHYEHHSGGSNGNSRDFVAIVRKGFRFGGEEVELVDLVDHNTYRAISQIASAKTRAYIAKQGTARK